MKMMIGRATRNLGLLFLLFVMVACETVALQQSTTTPTLPVVPTVTATETATIIPNNKAAYLPTYQAKQTRLAYISTYAARQTQWVMRTQTAALTRTPIEVRKTAFAAEMDQNFDCQFPCLFGVRPGITKWEDAVNYFSKYPQFVQVGDNPGTFYYEDTAMTFSISNKSGIVYEIIISSSPVGVSEIIATYGVPEEIRFKTRFGMFTSGPTDFDLALYYGDRSFIAWYSYSDATIQEQTWSIKICYNTLVSDAESNYIDLWPRSQQLDFVAVALKFLGVYDSEYPYQRIQDVSPTNPEEFTRAILDANEDYCIDTPATNWK
ncbi:MAG: hypothetical protein JXB38_13430 [Anaerolineales bacterium]|nr:hypothetical protein [Anaerolineales bacterium]